MRAAACAAVICATALASGCGDSSDPSGFAHPRVLSGTIEQPDQQRIGLRQGTSVDFVSDDLGYLATQAGVILRTDDGGSTWKAAAGRAPRIADLDFVAPDRGFGLTERNVLLETTDAARTWQPLYRFARGTQDETGWSLEFVDAGHGWAVPAGGPLYRTQDGGRSWTALSLPCGEYDSPVGPAFFDSAHGYEICGGEPGAGRQRKSFYATSDGGATWEQRSRDWSSGFGYARQLVFRAPDDGLFFTDRGGLSRTNAAGVERLVLLTDDEDWVTDIAWPSARRIYVMTFHAGLLRSDDGGAHWRRLYGGDAPPPIGAVAFRSSSQGVGFGAETLLGGPKAVFATKDGGRSWARLAIRLPLPFADQVFRFGDTIIAANGGGFTRSDDAGRHWHVVLVLPRSRAAWFDFLTPEIGYRAEGKTLLRTDDGGSTWSLAARADIDLQGVVFMTDKDAFVVDYGDPPPDDGKKHASSLVDRLMESHDGGVHWQAVKAPLLGEVLAMYRLDNEHWWLVANVSCPRAARVCGGQLWRTADGGRNWDLIELPRELTASSLSFVSPQVGFARGPGSGLSRTTDGGVSWSYVYPR